MKRNWVNFIFAKDWSYLFPEEDVINTSNMIEAGIAHCKTQNGGAMKIRMDAVVAIEFFERDFEAEQEQKAEADNDEPRH